MTEKELYNQLKEAYSDKNLNIITGKLIDLYKNKNFSQIRTIAGRIDQFVDSDTDNSSKCFTKLMMLYHPDKGEFYRKLIDKSYNENDFEKLTEYSHILLLDDFENVTIEVIDEDIDYHPEYKWDNNQKGYDYFFERGTRKNKDQFAKENEFEKTFYNAVKMRMYGDLNMEFPSYYLEDFDDIEFADSGIESLDGVEHCKHAVSLDLSDNSISDISELWGLGRLEELYLANNQIGYIDSLSNLLNLRVIDLSGNQIDDISPLFNLENLEYVNLMGNQIPISQINQLIEKEIIVLN